MTADSLGDRMKGYEASLRLTLPWRMPVIVRVDGKSFHTVLAKAKKPFCNDVFCAMNDVAVALCEEIQGAALAYVQSDEVSVLVHGYRTIQSQPWFGNDLQKVVSVAAAVATRAWCAAWEAVAEFDARAFVLPEAEVCNYFIWRQQDATRNSIQSLAQSLFSPRELLGVPCDGLQELCWQKGQNWNDLPVSLKRGRCVNRHAYVKEDAVRHEWRVDVAIPVFTQDRWYVERHLTTESQ